MQTYLKTFDTSNATLPLLQGVMADRILTKKYFSPTSELIGGDDHLSAVWPTKPAMAFDDISAFVRPNLTARSFKPANDSVYYLSAFGYMTIGLAIAALAAIFVSIVSAVAITGDPLGVLLPVGSFTLLVATYLAASPKVKRNWKKR